MTSPETVSIVSAAPKLLQKAALLQMLGKAVVDEVLGFLGDLAAGFAPVQMFFSIGVIRQRQNIVVF